MEILMEPAEAKILDWLSKWCEGCNQQFLTKCKTDKFCCTHCKESFIEGQRLVRDVKRYGKIPVHRKKATTEQNLVVHKIPKRYYVYAWLDVNKIFYIGKGFYSRAFSVHSEKAEEYRKKCQRNFRVIVIRDNLSSQEAFQIENILIGLIQPECNQVVKRLYDMTLSPYLI